MSRRLHRLARWLSIALAWVALTGPGALAEATPHEAEIALVERAVTVAAPAIRAERLVASPPPAPRVGWLRTRAEPRAPALDPPPTQRRFLRHCALLR